MTEPVLIRELEAITRGMAEGFRGVHDRLDRMTERQQDTERTVAVVVERQKIQQGQVDDVAEQTATIYTEGCMVGKLMHGAPAGQGGAASWWTPKRTAGVTVGGTGVLLALVELGKAILQAATK